MQLDDFFSRYLVFNREEYVAYMNSRGTTNSNTQRELLAYHLKKGRIVKIRRGFYATVSRTVIDPSSMPIDGSIIAGRIAKDAVLSYHTALDFHGVSHSVYFTFYFCTRQAIKTFDYRGNTFHRVPFPNVLIDKKNEHLATEMKERQGQDVCVSTLERTLVDVLDRPDLGGGWEEIWRSLEKIAVLDLDLVIQYALALENATTIAKVGFFLETHQDDFAVNEQHLSKLKRFIPRNKHYMDHNTKKPSKLIKQWNLMVPIEILGKQWEEPDYDI